jgi:uncharacterized membrane protein YhfC
MLAFWLTRRFRLSWRLFWIGAATFVLSQLGHIPFNAGVTVLFQRGILPTPPDSGRLVFNAVFLGLSAGLWEELARYAVYRWWAKDARSWSKALLLGGGHGGIEAILLGLYVLFIFIQMLALRGANLEQLGQSQAAQVQQQVAIYWSYSGWSLLAGALERAFTIPAHIAFSVIVLQAFTRGRFRWVWLAVGLHALMDALSVYLAGITNNPALVEVVIAGFALLSLAIIFLLRQPEPPVVELVEANPTPAADFHLPAPDETTENLDNTRYN